MKTYEEFRGQGVEFVGLTPETENDLAKIEAWKKRLEIPWALGFGAKSTLQQFEIPGYPTTFVIGRDGKVAWHSFYGGSLTKAIQQALN